VMNVALIKGYEYGVVVSHINISSWYLNKEENSSYETKE
jgi:hypothetical protein